MLPILMATLSSGRWRHVLPWAISAALLVYVFGWATDWDRMRAATEQANVPLFVLFATVDRLGFFVVWTLLQAAAQRRFVSDVPVRSVIAVRGGSELLRPVSNPLSDAAFFLGLSQLVRGRMDAVLGAALVPSVCHIMVMLVQMTVALPLLEGGISKNRDVFIGAVVMWSIILAIGIGLRVSARRGVALPGVANVRQWMERFPLRALRPFFLGFAALSVFDVVIQGLASRAFGVFIDWSALAARIPLLYLALVIPSLGNFGTRELTWAALFSGYGDRDTLLAYAFASNAVFLVINVLLGVIFLSRAIELLSAVRRARQRGDPIPSLPVHDPTDL